MGASSLQSKAGQPGAIVAAGIDRSLMTSACEGEMRILVLAPTSNDARLTAKFLEKAGLEATVCSDISELCGKMSAGCGAMLLAEEALAGEALRLLWLALENQPSWSDLPILMMTGTGGAEARDDLLARLALIGNMTIIERPVRPGTLVSTLMGALLSRRRQYQVRALLQEREETNRRKDEFLAMLSHELRNPLASVANAAALLKDPADAESRVWAAEVIGRQSRQLSRLIEDLLDVSRITSGKIRLRKEATDAAILLSRACETVRPLMDERRHRLVCQYERDVHWVNADPVRIEQIVLNLLTNAAKYTPTGGRVELSAFREGSELVITVRDNGLGIAPDRLPDIFKLFVQGERSMARSEGGLGIGLTIVRKLVELHDGRIEAHSDGPDRGSVFTLRLPACARPVGKVPMPMTAEKTRPLRVLIVDDNVDTARTLGRLLSLAGHQVVMAHEGIQALEQARIQMPEAVILDIGLPGMDGHEVARQLRRDPAFTKILLIAVTGYGQDEDRRQALEAGFNHHLTKPVEVEDLKRLLASV